MGEKAILQNNKTTAIFAIKTKRQDDYTVIDRIGHSYICHPEINFNGGSVRWLPDKKRGAS